MQLGIFAKTFIRGSFEEVFDAVRDNGLNQVQFNMACTGLETLPDYIDTSLVDSIRKESINRGVDIARLLF